jgi:hypothetical protein
MQQPVMSEIVKNIKQVSLRTHLNQLFHTSKESSKKRALKGRLNAGEHNISFSFLEDIWHKQNGRCYYSNIEMQFNKNEWKVSIERKDTSKGYTQDNVVLCCQEFNTKTQWCLEKIMESVHILNNNIECVNSDFSFSRTRQKYSKVMKLESKNVIYYRCTYCKRYKTRQEFKNIGENCKACVQQKVREKQSTPRGHMIKLCYTAKKTATFRSNKSTSNSERCIYDIDLNFLIKLYKEQKGLCAYSGLPLQFGSYLDKNWVASLERIDVTKGYTKDNVCLICLEFNSADRTIMTGPEYGCAGWNALKFQYFLAHVKHKKGLITGEELQAVMNIQEQFQEKTTYLGTQRKPRQFTRKEVIGAIHFQKRIYENAHEHYGHIYIITSPSGKQFVGQSHLLYHKKDTTLFGHARKLGCTRLMKEVELYGEDKMSVEVIACCRKDKLDYYQDYFITEYNTFAPHGLNNRLKHKDEVKVRITQTLVDNAIRYDVDGTQLPKYVKYVDWKDRKGYAIISHPRCKKKDFVSQKLPLDTLKARCIAFLEALE